MRIRHLAMLLLATSGTLGAGTPHEISYLATISGSCSGLVIADVEQNAECPDKLLNTAYADNYSSFKVMTKNGMVISFFGYDHEAVGDTAHLTVERILITPVPKEEPGDTVVSLAKKAMALTQDLPAIGDCEYSNPALPDSHVNCAATAAGKTYSFKFHPTDFQVAAPSN